MSESIISIQRRKLLEIWRDCEFNVIPIDPQTKSPYYGECWKRWQTERQPAQLIWHWNDQYQGFGLNWGIITGPKPWSQIPGIVCVDADDAVAVDLVREYCPPTPLETTTPRGGKHFLYRHPGNVRIQQRIKTTIGGVDYNLDIKADGNQILAPGSFKKSGVYTASCAWTPEILQALPIYSSEWLPHAKAKTLVEESRDMDREDYDVDRPNERKAEPRRIRFARRWLARRPGAKKGRGADSYCYALAMSLVWGFYLPLDEAEELLMEWGMRYDQTDEYENYYPWTAQQIRHKIRDATVDTYKDEPGNLYVEEGSLDLDDDFYEAFAKMQKD